MARAAKHRDLLLWNNCRDVMVGWQISTLFPVPVGSVGQVKQPSFWEAGAGVGPPGSKEGTEVSPGIEQSRKK